MMMILRMMMMMTTTTTMTMMMIRMVTMSRINGKLLWAFLGQKPQIKMTAFRQMSKLPYFNLYLNKNWHTHSVVYLLLVVRDDKT